MLTAEGGCVLGTIELPPDARSVGAARLFVTESLSGVLDEVVDTVMLLVSELVTNAVLHAKSTVVVGVIITGHLVRVEVSDGSDRKPTVRRFSTKATSGRGLGLLDALATQWGTVLTPPGKMVWFELAM